MSEKQDIYKLVSKVMESIGAIGKGQENKFDHYRFRGIDDVYNAVQPALVKHGVFCLPRVLESEQKQFKTSKGATMIHTIIKASYTLYAPDGSFIVGTAQGEGMDRGDKSINKAMSSAFKNFMFEAFCIPVDEGGSKDSEDDSPEGAATPPAKAKAKKPAPKKKPAEQPPWVKICQEHKDTGKAFKELKLTKAQGNSIWAGCDAETDEQARQQFIDAIKAQLDEQLPY